MPHSVADWPHDIHVVGMGGIGTHVLQSLLEHGARVVHIWDDDLVESHNLPTQFLFAKSDIGSPKVIAASKFVEDRGFSTAIVTHQERITDTTKLSGLVISGVDTMASRAEIWESIRYDSDVYLYIDARIGGEELQVHTVDPSEPEDVARYSRWIFPDTPTNDLGCVTRENPHSALGIAQVVSAHLTLYMKGEPVVGYVSRNLLTESRNEQQSLVVHQ